ncbi:MAG: cob(I)yrinic acid a,c-diamide adenosyltransferase [Bdellovibrionales bacterium]|nr:cob(I)yrinic acid a,c-diamide adenosyltransferase [Bdellovibrionales bacterium]
MAKVYTRTGDQGTTGLISGTRVSKTDLRIAAYGTVDELNAVLGLALSYWQQSATENKNEVESRILKVQNQLFNYGCHLACDKDSLKASLPAVDAADVEWLEKTIDHCQEALPELREFIIPGGGKTASTLHLARTVCRRAERVTLEAFGMGGEADLTLQYLNRLSDWLFVLARYCNHIEGITDRTWKK